MILIPTHTPLIDSKLVHKLAALSGYKLLEKKIDELEDTYATCQRRVVALESQGGSVGNDAEIATLKQAMQDLEAAFQEQKTNMLEKHQNEMKEMMRNHQNELQTCQQTVGEWCPDQGCVEWEEKHERLLNQLGQEREKRESIQMSLSDAEGKSHEEVERLQKNLQECNKKIESMAASHGAQVRKITERYQKESKSLSEKGGSSDDATNARMADLEMKLSVLTDGDKQGQFLRVYMEKYGQLTPSDFVDKNTIEGIDALMLKNSRLVMWFELASQIVTRRGKNNIMSMISRHEEYLRNTPNAAVLELEENSALEQKVHTVDMKEWDDQTTAYFHNQVAKCFIGDSESIKQALEAFTQEQRDAMEKASTEEATRIRAMIEKVSEELSHTLESTPYVIMKRSIRFVYSISENFTQKLIRAFEEYIPVDFATKPTDEEAGGDTDIFDYKPITVFTKKMMDQNPKVEDKKLVNTLIDMAMEMRKSGFLKQVLVNIRGGKTSTTVSLALKKQAAEAEIYKILVFPFIDRDIKATLDTTESWVELGAFMNETARTFIGGQRSLGVTLPPPTMEYVKNSGRSGQVFIPQKQHNLENPMDNIPMEKIRQHVTAVLGYNKGLSKRFPELVPPQDGPFDTEAYSEVEHGAMYKKVILYMTAKRIHAEVLRVLGNQFPEVSNVLKQATDGGAMCGGRFQSFHFSPKGIVDNIKKPTDIREFVYQYQQFMSEYTETNVDMIKFSKQFKSDWEKLVEKFKALECLVEYFRLEPLVLATVKETRNYDDVKMTSIIDQVAEKKRKPRGQESEERLIATGLESSCLSVKDVISKRDAFGKAWELKISDGLVGKMKRITVSVPGGDVSRKITDAQIDTLLGRDVKPDGGDSEAVVRRPPINLMDALLKRRG